uniref:Cell division protein n=1 Tax=Pediastrum duplex TaxID=3105 RepID=A0A2U8GIM2_PEDDU|nr:cell division protein [Pediastrum duplex]
MQYWIFPLIGFVGLTWNKNSNLFEIIDFKKSFLYSDKTNIHNILNKKYNLNQIPKSVESSFTFPIQQKQNKKNQENYQNDLYEYYFMAKSELEQKLLKLNYYGNQPFKFSIQNSQIYEKNSMLLNSFLWSKSGTIEIGSFFLNNKFNLKNQRNNILTTDLNFNCSHSNTYKEKSNFFFNTDLTNIVPTLTSNIREIYKKSPKKLLPISMHYKNLNNSKSLDLLLPSVHFGSFTSFGSASPSLHEHKRFFRSLREGGADANEAEEEAKEEPKEAKRNKIKKNTLFSIIEIPNTFCITPITQKQKGILHNHPIRSYEKAKILLDNAIKNSLLKQTKNKDKNFKNIISMHSLDKLKNQSYFINKNLTKSKLLFNFSILKSSQQNRNFSESKILPNLFFSRFLRPLVYFASVSSSVPRFHIAEAKASQAKEQSSRGEPKQGERRNEEPKKQKSNFLKPQNKKIKENDIFVKKISEKLKFDLDKLLFSKRFKKNFILFNKKNNPQNKKTNLKFLFLLHSNLKNTNKILKKFKKIKGSMPSIKENNMKNYIYELSVLNYWKKSLNLLNLNNNKISYSSKFCKKERLFESFAKLLESSIPNLQSEGVEDNFQFLIGPSSSLVNKSSLPFASVEPMRSRFGKAKVAEAEAPFTRFFGSRKRVGFAEEGANADAPPKQTEEKALWRSQAEEKAKETEKRVKRNKQEEFFNKFAKIQKLLNRYSKDSSLLTFQTSNLNPIKLNNSILTSNLFYKDNFNILSNKFIYNKEQNLVNNYHLYSYNRNSKENYINKNFYRKNKKVLGKFIYKSIMSKMNDFNKNLITNERLTTKFKDKKIKTFSESKISKNKEKNYLHSPFALSRHSQPLLLSHRLCRSEGSRRSEGEAEQPLLRSQPLLWRSRRSEGGAEAKGSEGEAAGRNFILNLKQISFINLNYFYSKLYMLIDNLYKILSNDLTKKTTFLETNINNIKIIKSNIKKKLIKKNNFKVFKLDLNTKTLNKNFRQNKKEKIFRTLLSYKFSKANFKNIKLKKNILSDTLLIPRSRYFARFFGKAEGADAEALSLPSSAKPSLHERLHFFRSLREGEASASFGSRKRVGFAEEGANEAEPKEPKRKEAKPKELKPREEKMANRFASALSKQIQKKLKKRMRNLLSIYSNKNIQYKYYKKNTFKKLNSLNSAPLFSQSVIVNKTRFEKKEKNYKNSISLNRILRRIGFVFLSELKIKKNYSHTSFDSFGFDFASFGSFGKAERTEAKEQGTERTEPKRGVKEAKDLNKKESLIQRFEKEKSLQKRRRRKKLKLETRRRKKRKRFYPRPVWLRYSLYKKFLNFRHSYNNFYYKTKVCASFSSASFAPSSAKPTHLREPKEAEASPSRSERKKRKRSRSEGFAEEGAKKNELVNKVYKQKKVVNISNFFLKNQKLKNKIYRNNKQKWGNFIQDTPQFEKISLKKINFLQYFPIFQNKEYYKVSGRILAEFQPLCWKSYWLRSNLTPYMNRIEKNFSFMKQVEKTNNISNINTFLHKIFGFFSYDFYSFKFKMLPFYTDFKNSFDNQHAFYLSNLFFQESTNKIAEYNRIEFERFSEILKNVKFNMNLEGQLKPKSYKFIAWKYLLSSPRGGRGERELKTFNKKNFWYRLSYNMNPNLSSVSPFVILSNTFSKNSPSIKPYGSSGTLRALWTFNKTNIFTFKEKNQIRNLWEQTKLREQLKSNQTKKFLMNLIRVQDNLYLKDIFYNSFLSFDFINSQTKSAKNPMQRSGSHVEHGEGIEDPSLASVSASIDENNKMLKTKKPANFKDFKNLNSMNFSTIKKLQTAQKKLVLMSLFQQKSQKKSINYILNNTNNISYNYYIRLLKSKISNSPFRIVSSKNKKDPPINIAKPRLLKPSSYFWWSSKNFQMPFNLNMFNDSYTSLFFFSESKIPNNLQFKTIYDYSESSNKKETSNSPIAQQQKTNKLIVYNILIFLILFHLSILFSFIRIPELRGLLKFQILLFYKISNSYFIILYSIYDLLKKYKKETLKTYNSLYQKTYKLLSYINILDLESQSLPLFHSFGNSNYPGFDFEKGTKKILFSRVFNLSHASPLSKFPNRLLSALLLRSSQPLLRSLLASAPFAPRKKRRQSRSSGGEGSLHIGSFHFGGAEAKEAKEVKGSEGSAERSGGFIRSFGSAERSGGFAFASFAERREPMQAKEAKERKDPKRAKGSKRAKNQSALKYPKIYNKDLKSYFENNRKDLSSRNLSKSFTTYITSQKPFIYSFSYNIVEFLYTKKILNKILSLGEAEPRSGSASPSERSKRALQAKKGRMSPLQILKLDIKKNSMTELYKRFISFRNIQTYFALFFLYFSYGLVHLSIGLFESTYQFLLKIIDLFESFLLIIYKFLEKPAELMIEWIAQIFLIEWSSDPSSFIPETFDMYFWYSFQKFFRNTRILGFVEFQNSTNIYNIMNSLELSGFGIFDSKFNGKPIQLHNYNNDILSLEKTLGTSMLSFSISNILGFFMQRRLWNFFHLFIDSMLKPDIDLIVRQKKGKIFWDIWADILIRAAEQYNINIPSLTSLKEEQEKLIERLIQDPAFINFSILNSDYKNIISSPFSNNLQSTIKTTYNFKNKSKISNIFYNKNVLKNFYKTKSWSSNQYVTFNLKDTDLFLDISPPKSLLYVHFINGYEPIQYTLGSIMCEIYSGLFSHKVSKNLLIVNSHVSDLPLRSAISSNFLNSTKSSFDFQSRGSYGSLIIQALAGESEMKMMIDNANRYASVQRGVAVGMKLLRDVFESIVLQTPCFFLMEDLHVIGERRSMLISDDENSYEKEFSIFGFEQDEESEKNQMIYQSSRHSINDFRRPYKGDFSMLIPTNLYNKNLYSFKTFLNNTKPTHQKKYPISLPSLLQSQNKSGADANTIENKMFGQSFNISRLQIASENFFAPPATSPFTILMMKEQRKLKPKKVVKQISWNSFVAENIITSKNDSIRAKVAILADMTLRNFSYNKDMITDLLVIIDGVRSNRGFVVFATTHLPSILDPALRRPGRFDETISLPLLPNLMNRWSLFQMHFGTNLLYSASERKKILQKKFSHFLGFAEEGERFGSPLLLPQSLRIGSFAPFGSASPSLRERKRSQSEGFIRSFGSAERSGGFAEAKEEGTKVRSKLKHAQETFDRFDYGILTENFNFSQISNLISKAKLSCNVNYNSAKSPIIHPSQALQSFFIELVNKVYKQKKDYRSFSQSEEVSSHIEHSERKNVNKIILFNSSNKNFKKIYSQISFGYFQIGNLLISSDFLKDQTYFSLYNKSLILEQSSPFVFHTLYSSLNTFKMFIMRLLGGKIAEFLVSKNQRNLYNSFTSSTCFFRSQPLLCIGGAEAKGSEGEAEQPLLRIGSADAKGSERKKRGKSSGLNFSTTDHMIRYKSWHFATSLIFSILQKRFLYNKNLIITKMLSFDNPNQSSLREPPSPPASSLLMPSKKYENFKRIEHDFQQKATFSIYEKMQMHQKQRFLKRLYNKPVLESFKSQLFENRFTSFESSFKEFSYNKDSNLLKLSSSHSYYKNRLNIRHRFSLINQWWNGQLAEHNVEVTYLSDIDWRTMYIQSFASSHQSLIDDLNNTPSYEKLGLKQSKSILSHSKTLNKTDSTLDFPDADQHYNPRIRRWFLNANSWNYWLNFENTFYYEIYSHMIYDIFNKTSLYFNQNRELLDFFVYTYNIKGSLKEIDLIFILSRFYRK